MSRPVVGAHRQAQGVPNAPRNRLGKRELRRPDTPQTTMRLLAAFLTLFLVVAGCDSADDAAGVLLRVENATAVDFTSVSVGFTGEATDYGAVRAGRASEYRAFGTAYTYGALAVRAADGRLYDLVPYDFVGEEPLAPGRYTYRLRVEGGRLLLEFEQD